MADFPDWLHTPAAPQVMHHIPGFKSAPSSQAAKVEIAIGLLAVGAGMSVYVSRYPRLKGLVMVPLFTAGIASIIVARLPARAAGVE